MNDEEEEKEQHDKKIKVEDQRNNLKNNPFLREIPECYIRDEE